MSKGIPVIHRSISEINDSIQKIKSWLRELDSATGGTTDLSNYVTSAELDVTNSNVYGNSAKIQTLEEQDAARGIETYVTVNDESGALPNSIQYSTIKLDNLASPEDNTDLNASTSAHGLCPKGSASASQFLNGNLGWSAPAGGTAYATDFSGSMAGDQALTTGVITPLVIDTADWDVNSEHDAVNNCWVCVDNGTYCFIGGIRYTSNATGLRWVAFRKDAVATYYGGNKVPACSGEAHNITAATTIQCAAGEKIYLMGYQTSGGNLNAESHIQTFLKVFRVQ